MRYRKTLLPAVAFVRRLALVFDHELFRLDTEQLIIRTRIPHQSTTIPMAQARRTISATRTTISKGVGYFFGDLDLANGGDDVLSPKYALVVLNQSIPRFTPLLWQHEQQRFDFAQMEDLCIGCVE
ncbi:unnamed protein product [Rhodiola kirilowii]